MEEGLLLFARYCREKRYDEAKAFISRQDVSDPNVLVCFCEYGPDDPEWLQCLLDLGVIPTIYALLAAANADNLRLMRKLIDVGVDVNETDWNGWTIMDHARIEYTRKATFLIIDAGGKYLRFEGEDIPFISLIRKSRESLRSCAIAMIGVITRRSPLRGERGIGDVTRMIARVIWESRGTELK
jgi:hypothetical protein